MKTETNMGASQQKSISFCWSWTVAKPHHAGEAYENRLSHRPLAREIFKVYKACVYKVNRKAICECCDAKNFNIFHTP